MANGDKTFKFGGPQYNGKLDISKDIDSEGGVSFYACASTGGYYCGGNFSYDTARELAVHILALCDEAKKAEETRKTEERLSCLALSNLGALMQMMDGRKVIPFHMRHETKPLIYSIDEHGQVMVSYNIKHEESMNGPMSKNPSDTKWLVWPIQDTASAQEDDKLKPPHLRPFKL